MAAILPLVAFAATASAQAPGSDERFLMGFFLPFMIAVGVLIVVGAIVASVVSAKRRRLRMPPPFDPTLGPPPTGFGAFGDVPPAAPRVTSRKTTTTNADGSVTVTVIEETTGTLGSVVAPELLQGKIVTGELEQEILAEVRDAFRRIDPHQNGR